MGGVVGGDKAGDQANADVKVGVGDKDSVDEIGCD